MSEGARGAGCELEGAQSAILRRAAARLVPRGARDARACRARWHLRGPPRWLTPTYTRLGYHRAMRKLTVCFATLCMLAAPAMATPKPVPAQTQKVPVKKPASADELQGYAMRERVAE